jgi:formate C-acetyltransferase
MIEYAQRNAELADTLAQGESDPARSAELREMARVCRKVPAEPAESWWEALQAFHFLRLGTTMAEGADSHAAGRFDQYMLPYLQQDLDSGELSPARAQELLECLFLKWNETRRFAMSRGSTGGGNNDKLNLGGMDDQGRDCTNELSYMLLEAHAHVHLSDPNLSVRLHNNTPREFLQQVLEVLRLGGGLPILLNDEVIVPALTSSCGVRLDHARHYGDLGCQENVTDPNMTGADTNGRTNAGWVALPKPIELALYNGVNPTNGTLVGPQTGNAPTFATMEQFLQAVRTQIEHAVDMNVRANNTYDHVFTRHFPCVFHNLMHPGPRASGIDINTGGCHYNWAGPLCVGMANAGDMLAAIDHLIFRTKQVTWDELLQALQRDWEGADQIRRACIESPKYGCDDEYADGWVRTMLGMYFDAYERHPTSRGGHFVVGLISMSNYVSLGHWLGATPDGRRSGTPLADATSPSSLAPGAGPTATHRSAARAIDAYHVPNGLTFNQRFGTASVSTPRELSKWADLVRSYMEDGGLQVQYTVVSQEDLKRAQRHPGEYRDLIVRVGGYSAVFVELSREVQDTIIARAELAL